MSTGEQPSNTLYIPAFAAIVTPEEANAMTSNLVGMAFG